MLLPISAIHWEQMSRSLLALCLVFLWMLVSVSVLSQTPEPSMMQKLFLAKQVFPSCKTIGVLCHTHDSGDMLRALTIAGNAYQVDVKVYDVKDILELRSGFDKMMKASKIDIVWIVPDDVANQAFGRRFLSEKCLSMKIPLFVPSVEYLHEGALFSVSTDTSGATKMFVNTKVKEMIGLVFPPEVQAKIVEIEY